MKKIKKYKVSELKHMSGKALNTIAMDKRQKDDVRLAALDKARGMDTVSEIINDPDNSLEVRQAAKKKIHERQLFAQAAAGFSIDRI